MNERFREVYENLYVLDGWVRTPLEDIHNFDVCDSILKPLFCNNQDVK